MWFFSRKYNIIDTPFFDGFKDYHNHTLPGVDDGVRSLDDSLAALSYFESLKFKEIVLTPHVMTGVNDKSNDAIFAAYDSLLAAYKGPIKLSLASEYMLDSGFMRQLAQEPRMVTGNNLLVETSYFSAPSNLSGLLYEISSEGISPLIAHPERYVYMDRKHYHSLKENGYNMQLNILSFSGAYGSKVIENALYLLEHGMYNVIGSDFHGITRFKSYISKVRLSSKHLEMLMGLKDQWL